MAEFRSIQTRFWRDPYIEELSFAEKAIYLYLMTNCQVSISGIYQITERVIVFETGADRSTVRDTLSRLQRDGKILYQDSVLWIRNFHKYNSWESPKVRAKVRADLEMIPDCFVKDQYLAFFYGDSEQDSEEKSATAAGLLATRHFDAAQAEGAAFSAERRPGRHLPSHTSAGLGLSQRLGGREVSDTVSIPYPAPEDTLSETGRYPIDTRPLHIHNNTETDTDTETDTKQNSNKFSDENLLIPDCCKILPAEDHDPVEARGNLPREALPGFPLALASSPTETFSSSDLGETGQTGGTDPAQHEKIRALDDSGESDSGQNAASSPGSAQAKGSAVREKFHAVTTNAKVGPQESDATARKAGPPSNEPAGPAGPAGPTGGTSGTSGTGGEASPERKREYGEFQNVRLTDAELLRLIGRFPRDWTQRIERLGGWKKAKGKAMSSDYAAILNWARRDGDGGDTAGAEAFAAGIPKDSVMEAARKVRTLTAEEVTRLGALGPAERARTLRLVPAGEDLSFFLGPELSDYWRTRLLTCIPDDRLLGYLAGTIELSEEEFKDEDN